MKAMLKVKDLTEYENRLVQREGKGKSTNKRGSRKNIHLLGIEKYKYGDGNYMQSIKIESVDLPEIRKLIKHRVINDILV